MGSAGLGALDRSIYIHWGLKDPLGVGSSSRRLHLPFQAVPRTECRLERESYIHWGLKDPLGVGSSSRGLHLPFQAQAR